MLQPKLICVLKKISDAFDNELMKQSVHDLLMGKKVDLPVYDFKTHTR